MKLLLLFILLPFIGNSQVSYGGEVTTSGTITLDSGIGGYYGYDPYRKIESKYDTTVLANPSIIRGLCINHNYVNQRVDLTRWVTAEYNPLGKCYSGNAICTNCYKHIHIQERRWFVEDKDEYAEALKVLEKYTKSKN